MSFSTYFSEQAKKPAGLFGRLVMSNVFNIGNAKLNSLVFESMEVQDNDHILEIGFGTGKLIYAMAAQTDKGIVEGIDFSSTMVSIAQRRNKKYTAKGKVKILQGNFDETVFNKESFSKVCSVNTLYFWPKPEFTAKKIADILEPGGMLVLAFEDISQLAKRQLSNDVFRLYSKNEVKNLLSNAGFSNEVRIESREFGKSILNCAVAIK